MAGLPLQRIPRASPPGKLSPISFSKKAIRREPRKCFGRRRRTLANDPQGVRILADYYAGSGQMDKAKAEFSSLAAKYPKNISVQKGYIRVLLEIKDYRNRANSG